MSRSYHMKVDLRGLLRGALNVRAFEGMLKHPTEDRPMTGDEAFDAIVDQLHAGRSYIPMCPLNDCPNFDFHEEGCPGHPMEPQLKVVNGGKSSEGG